MHPSGHEVITAREAVEIRQLRASGVPRAVVAERYGLAPSTVSNITARRRWRRAI
jgi:IS30 family transposase